MNLLEEFISFLANQKNPPSQATIKNYKADIKQFISWFEFEFSIPFNPPQVTINHINLYKNIKISGTSAKQGLSHRSLDRHLSSLRKFFYFLKIEGLAAQNPIQAVEHPHAKPHQDSWHLKQFKDHLYVYNLSTITIKNYIIDVRQFLTWAEQVSGVKQAWELKEKNIFDKINNKLLEEYKGRLLTEVSFSPTSINRKLSSLRKYFKWASEEGFLKEKPSFQSLSMAASAQLFATPKEAVLPLPQVEGARQNRYQNIENGINSNQSAQLYLSTEPVVETISQDEEEELVYSPFPPLRLMQKTARIASLVFDSSLVVPIAEVVAKLEYLKWMIFGKQLFGTAKLAENIVDELTVTKSPEIDVNEKKRKLLEQAPKKNNIFPIGNFKKEFFAPLAISTKYFPWYRKIWYHMRHNRPEWYRRYHSYALVHYFHFAVLIIFMSGLGFGIYRSFFEPAGKQPTFAALPTAPPRVLSFQGRLTDITDTPITAATDLRFAIYNNETSTGSALLWEEVNRVTPDSDGIFSLLLGKGTTISQTLFAQNASLWLGITVKNDSELTPRQQLATVAYATNAETLQGLPPITQSGVGTKNVVLAMDSGGNLHIGGSDGTTFDATGGQFKISGKPLLLTTNAGSNGNVQIAPDGLGGIDLQKPLLNTTNNNNISTAVGAVEVDDLFAILATSSGQSALTINQDGGGPILSASASGVEKFTVGNNGSGYFAGSVGIGASPSAINKLEVLGSIYANQGQVRLGNFSSAPVTVGAGSLYYDTTSQQMFFNNGSSWLGVGTNYWQQVNGALSPLASSVDFLLGSNATASAKFAVLNMASGTPTASISATSTGTGLAFGGDGSIQALRNNTLTVGGNTTGNINFKPGNSSQSLFLGSSGNVGIGTTSPVEVLHVAGNATASGNLTLSGAARSIQTTANNTLTIGGNTTGSIVIDSGNSSVSLADFTSPGTLTYISNSSGLLAATSQGVSGQCLLSGASTAPSWGTCALGTNYWTASNGALYPINTTLDMLVGGTATLSAKFAVFNMNSGTPTASISATTQGTGISLGGDGSIQSVRNNTLTIGGNTTGNITISPLNGSGITTNTGTFNLSSGKTYQINGADVLSATTLGSGVTSSSLTTVGTIVSGVWNGTVIGTQYGGTGQNFGSTAQGSLPYFNGTGTMAALAPGTSGFVLQTNGASANPSWIDSSTVGTNYWDRANGAVFPKIASIHDLLVGGTSTASAKFGFINVSAGTPTATISGNIALDSAGVIQTTKNQLLTIGGNTTGNITISPLNGSGTTTNTGTFNLSSGKTYQIGGVDVLSTTTLGSGVTSSSLTTVGTIASGTWQATVVGTTYGGTGQNFGSTAQGSLPYFNGTGTIAALAPGTSGFVLQTNGASANPSWVDASTVGTNYWDRANGAVFPKIASIHDLLLGSGSTSSAKFAVINIAAGTPTASVSAQNAAAQALVLAGDGSIQSVRNNTLTLGGSTTGDIAFKPNNVSTPTLYLQGGNVGIGTLNPTAKVEITGGAGLKINNVDFQTAMQFSSTSGGASTVSPNVIYTSGNGENIYFRKNGPAYIMIGIDGSTTRFQFGADASTVSYLNGGNFGIGTTTPLELLHVAGNATVSGNLTLSGSSRSIQSTANNTLTIGGNTTGNITISPLNGSGITTNTGTFNLSSGKTYQINATDVLSATTLGSGVTSSSLTTVGTIASGTWQGTLVGTTYGGTGQNFGSTAQGSLPYFNGTGTMAALAPGTSGFVLQTNGASANPSWVDASTVGTNYWDRANGAVYPKIATVHDLLIGGTSTLSAKFAVLNMNSGTPVASVSATGATNRPGISVGGDGTIQSLRNGTLTIGGNTTGNIALQPLNGTGNVGINTTTPVSSLELKGDLTQTFTEFTTLQTYRRSLDNGVFLTVADLTSGLTSTRSIQFQAGTTTTAVALELSSLVNKVALLSGSASGIDHPIIFGTSPAGVATERMRIDGTSGNLGLGTTTPSLRLHVQDTQSATGAAMIENLNTGTDADGLAIKLGGTTLSSAANCNSGSSCNEFLTFLNGNGVKIGKIHANGNNSVTFKPNGSDFAELFEKANNNEELPDGTLICLAPQGGVTKCDSQNKNILGVISDNAGFVGGVDGPNKVLVGLIGQLKIKMNPNSKAIQPGDPITASTMPGRASKASNAGQVIGQALESFDPKAPKDRILIAINGTWYDPNTSITSTGDLEIITQTNLPTYTIYNKSENQNITQIAAYAEAVIGNITAGTVHAKEVTTDSLSVVSSNFTIAGTSLKEYILTVVGTLPLIQKSQAVISPIGDVNELRANFISPLASDKLVVKLASSSAESRLEIQNASGSAVASIDNQGNAQFKGTLQAEDASISGTLRAKKIVADEVQLSGEALAKLQTNQASTSATYITNITNVYQSTPSANRSSDQISSPSALLANRTSASSSGTLNNAQPVNLLGYAPILNTVESLNISFGQFNQGLVSLGPTSLGDVSIAGQLAIGGNFIITDNSINVLGATLEIQPLRQGNLSFMGGLLTLDTDGNLKSAGNAQFEKDVIVKGVLAANILSPIPGSDMVIQLPVISNDVRSPHGISHDGRNDKGANLVIKNASGSSVLKIDQSGSITASGSGTFSDIFAKAFSIVHGAQADTSITETVATASAGTATIVAGETQRTIVSPYVTEKSLIYLTPASATQGTTPYISRQTSQTKEENGKQVLTGDRGSFTIEIPQRLYSDIKVNWWIVN